VYRTQYNYNWRPVSSCNLIQVAACFDALPDYRDMAAGQRMRRLSAQSMVRTAWFFPAMN
jgi:hypothetical protein